MNAARQITQLFQRPAGLLDGMVESHPKLPRIRRHLGLRHTKLQRKRDKPLLGAVVQVAFDLAAGLIGGGDDPRARRGKLGIQLGVVERDRELASDQLDGVEPLGGESPRISRFSSSNTARSMPRLRIGIASSEQQSASAK